MSIIQHFRGLVPGVEDPVLKTRLDGTRVYRGQAEPQALFVLMDKRRDTNGVLYSPDGGTTLHQLRWRGSGLLTFQFGVPLSGDLYCEAAGVAPVTIHLDENRSQVLTRLDATLLGALEVLAPDAGASVLAGCAACYRNNETWNVASIPFGFDLVAGGAVLEVTNEAFARAENLLKPSAPQFDFGDFDPRRGQIMDSWESGRHSLNGHESAVIRLGHPGQIRTVVIDTKWHDGNQAQAASLLASKDGKDWTRLVTTVPLDGHSLHVLRIENPEEWGYVKLIMYPDGGISRLRLYSEVPDIFRYLKPHNLRSPREEGTLFVQRHTETIVKPTKEPFQYPSSQIIEAERARVDWSQPVCLTRSALGATIAGASDQRYSHAGNVLKDGEPENMGDGWENARRRLGHDDLLSDYEKIWDHAEWIMIALSDRGTIETVGVDFRYFNFNNPAFLQIEGVDLPAGQPLDRINEGQWQVVVPKMPVKTFASQPNVNLPCQAGGPYTHLRVKIFPCGGVHRIRAVGRVS